MSAPPTLARRVLAEALGTGFLLATVVGSGVMGERLAGGNVAFALLANTLATGAALVALIAALAPLSGAHFNPAVTALAWSRRQIGTRDAFAYVVAQLAGAWLGVVAAHAMFELPLLAPSSQVRAGAAQWLSEFVATAGLLLVVTGCSSRPLAPIAIGAWVAAGYWFTASTCFANPAVTLARAATDTFAGIRPRDVPAFVLAQVAATVVTAVLLRWLHPVPSAAAAAATSAVHGSAVGHEGVMGR